MRRAGLGKKLDALPQGGRIAIPNDPTQGGRGLMLFAQAGAIQLPANADVRVTVADITGNPKRLRIVEGHNILHDKILDAWRKAVAR